MSQMMMQWQSQTLIASALLWVLLGLRKKDSLGWSQASALAAAETGAWKNGGNVKMGRKQGKWGGNGGGGMGGGGGNLGGMEEDGEL